MTKPSDQSSTSSTLTSEQLLGMFNSIPTMIDTSLASLRQHQKEMREISHGETEFEDGRKLAAIRAKLELAKEFGVEVSSDEVRQMLGFPDRRVNDGVATEEEIEEETQEVDYSGNIKVRKTRRVLKFGEVVEDSDDDDLRPPKSVPASAMKHS